MNRIPTALLAPAVVMALIASVQWIEPAPQSDQPDSAGAAAVQPAPAPPVATAPAPPAGIPSRKDDPGARRAYELMRLADPATGHLPHDIHRLEQEFASRIPVRKSGGLVDAIQARAPAAKKISGWVHRGPVNIGGRTRAVALDVTDTSWNTLLAGGVSGGMWRTTDAGATWSLRTGSSQLHSVTSVAQDTRPGHENVWYYTTGENRGNSASEPGAPYRGDGIFKSTDGGLTWSQLASTSTGLPQTLDWDFDYIWRIAIDPSNSIEDEVYAATRSGIHRSLDGGETWSPVLADTGSYQADVVVSPTGVVYATFGTFQTIGSFMGIYRSTDGVSWTRIDTLSNPFLRIVLGIAPSNEDVVYALVADLNESVNGEDYHGFFKYTYLSGDGSGAGGSWDDRSANIQALPDQTGPGSWAFKSYAGYCQTVNVNPSNENLVYIGGIHLIRSTDGFATGANTTWIGGWTYDNHHADQHWMLFEPGSSSRVITGSDGGVHRSFDVNAPNVVWESWNNGYNTSQFYTVAIDVNDPGNDIVIGGMQDNGTWWTNTTDGSVPWLEQLGGDGSFCSIADASGPVGTYYFSFQRGVAYRYSVDSLGNWINWTRVDPAGATNPLFVNPFITDPNATERLYFATDSGIWRNTNAEAIPLFSNIAATLNWDRLTLIPSGSSIGALAVTRDGSDTLIYGAADGHVYRVANASTVAGPVNPLNLTIGQGLPAGFVSSIAIHPNDGSKILIAYSNYNISNLWYTEDGGTSWDSVEGNLGGINSPSVGSVAILPVNGGNDDLFLAATSTGLYSVLFESGVFPVWEQEASDILGNVVVDMLATRQEDGLVVAGSHGRGVYSISIPDGVDAPVDPREVFLAQNAPNPFNPSTTVAFRLARAGHARITVHDVAGRLVRRLVDGWVDAGPRTVEWNGVDDAGRPVASGTYVLSLESAGESQTRKMTLVK